MVSSWAIRKQLTYFFIFLAIVFVAGFLLWQAINKPTCFDNKQNGGEKGIDCGGPCKKQCVGEVKPLNIIWAKAVSINNDKCDVVALVQNFNLQAALPSIHYKFRIFDKDNILIAEREGQTFFNANETFPIFEANIDIGHRIPAKTFIDFEENPAWEEVEEKTISLIIIQKQFSNTSPFPQLNTTISNKSVLPVQDIYANVILFDKNGNAVGASATRINSIDSNSSQEISFTWSKIFDQEPTSSQIFLRTRL